jgi:hypothetical protein
MSKNKLSKAELDRAKSLFMDYVAVTDIASMLGVNKDTLYYHTRKWKSERVLRANEMLADLSDSKIARMSNTFSDSFKSIQKWVEIKSRHPEELTPHEVKTMMSIISEMDKITRLDAGNPTDIVENTAPVDIIEVRKKIVKADPFLEEADYEELPHVKKDSEDQTENA